MIEPSPRSKKRRRRAAVVTGASRGLGRALAAELARLGWTVVIGGRDERTLLAAGEDIRSRGGEVVTVLGDITRSDHRAALSATAAALGGVDAVICNASALGPSPRPRLLDYPIQSLEHVLRVNVVAQLAIIQALAPSLRPGGRLVIVSSDAAVEPYAGWGGYGSSKAALERLGAVLACEETRWRVYRVDPGDMRTDMHQAAFPGEDIGDRPLPEDSVPGIVRLLCEDLPSGRYVTSGRELVGGVE